MRKDETTFADDAGPLTKEAFKPMKFEAGKPVSITLIPPPENARPWFDHRRHFRNFDNENKLDKVIRIMKGQSDV